MSFRIWGAPWVTTSQETIGGLWEQVKKNAVKTFQFAVLFFFLISHLIVSALVNLVDSADYLVAVKAMDALLVVCGLPDEEAAENAIRGTPLTQIVGKN